MLYSAKLKRGNKGYDRKTINARNCGDAWNKAAKFIDNDRYTDLAGVFLIGSKEDKQGHYSEDD